MTETGALLLTSFEAGLILGKSARTIQRMADRGEIAVAQKLPGPNGAFLFRQSDVDALRETQQASIAAQEATAS